MIRRRAITRLMLIIASPINGTGVRSIGWPASYWDAADLSRPARGPFELTLTSLAQVIAASTQTSRSRLAIRSSHRESAGPQRRTLLKMPACPDRETVGGGERPEFGTCTGRGLY